MNRSPLFYPMNRLDAEAGGSADLQTDVMRFMAIISMCLVAIFALVQSIPLAPRPVVEEILQATPIDAAVASPSPVTEAEAEIELTRPTPKRVEREPVETVVLERPRLKPVERRAPPVTRPSPVERPVERVPDQPIETSVERATETPIDAVEAMNVATAPSNAPESVSATRQSSTQSKVQKGFTLRFESDAALTELVARDVVGLYAVTPGGTKRMSIDGSNLSFWTASAPKRFHEMDIATVPDRVLATYRRTNRDSGVKWGVSLPAGMSRDLNDYLTKHDGGELIIARSGALRLEQ